MRKVQPIEIVTGQNLVPVMKLMKDVKAASAFMGSKEARYLVDTYYQVQDFRIAAAAQVRSMDQEPNQMLSWLFDQMETLEGQIKGALGVYAKHHPVGEWLLSIHGIGPVIAAGLLAHIDITKAQTAGAIWKFAGLDPDTQWNKGEKRPFNAKLKVLVWKMGESFVKVSGNENAVYGRLYKERKELEIARNEAGEFKKQAEDKLANFKIGKNTEAYKYYSQGKLPPAHLHARAKRYAVKILLSHLHDVWWREHYKTEPPKPFALAHLGHVHMIEVPCRE